MKNIVTFLLCTVALHLFSQKGVPYMVHFEPDENYQYTITSISQDARGIMLFSTKKGILTFDGFNWKLIKTEKKPVSINRDNQTSTNFVLFKNNFSALKTNLLGNFSFDSIFANPDSVAHFEYVNFSSKSIYIATETKIFILDREYNLSKTIETPSYNNGQFVIDDKLFVCDESRGLLKLEEDQLVPLKHGKQFKNAGILFHVPFVNNTNLLVFDNDAIVQFDGENFKPYQPEDYDYITNSIISSGTNINEQYFAISTLIGGTVIIQKASGETFSILNYQNGLPDDEIAYTYHDVKGGIWLAHEYGFTRVDMDIPIHSYHYFPNLTGNINAVYNHHGQLYVATSEGVFKLDKKEHKKAKEIAVKVKQQPKKAEKVEQKAEESKEAAPEIEDDEELSRKERRLLRRKQRKNAALNIISDVVETITETDTDGKPQKAKSPQKQQEEYKIVKKRIYELLSVSFEYIPISNLDDKVRTIFNYNDRIIVYANAGLYEIRDKQANAIFTGDYIYKFDVFEDYIWLYTEDGIKIVSFEDNFWNISSLVIDIQEDIIGIKSLGSKVLVAFPSHIQYITLDEDMFVEDTKTIPFAEEVDDDVFIRTFENEIYIFTADQVFQLNNEKLVDVSDQFPNLNLNYKYISNADGMLWIKQDNNWRGYKESIDQHIQNNFLNLFNKISYITSTEDNLWVVDAKHAIFKIPSDYSAMQQQLMIDLGAIYNAQRQLQIDDELSIKHSNSDLSFYLLSPTYQAKSGCVFQYKFEGLMKEWSSWSANPLIEFPFIPAGDYKLLFKSKDVFGNETPVNEISIDVKPPFYQTFWFFAIVVILIIVAAYFIMKLRERKLQHDKMILEQKVKERTAEVVRQKEEIAEQKEEIEASIYYAKRIQKAVVPSEEMAQKILPEHFILWKPRDIVSGDFYWLNEMDGKIIAVAADCTGHGVPGAFMSMLGVSFLNEIVANIGLEDAGLILDQLRNKVKTTLGQTGKEGEAKDGMDIAICIYEPKRKMLHFAGAYNPLYIIRKNEILETKADKMPIGIYIKEKEHFTNHQIQLEPKDTLYIFSDGYVDQFGGEKSGKFKPKRFKETILSIQNEPMQKQKEILDNTIEKWKGKNDQVDDILVIGFRV